MAVSVEDLAFTIGDVQHELRELRAAFDENAHAASKIGDVAVALGLPSNSSPEEIVAAARRLRQKLEAVEG